MNQFPNYAGYPQNMHKFEERWKLRPVTFVVQLNMKRAWFEWMTLHKPKYAKESSPKKNSFCMDKYFRSEIFSVAAKKNLFSNVLMIFICKLPINKIKGYLFSILSLSGPSSDSTLSGSPDNGPDKDYLFSSLM